jgi:hypothetical protein
MAHATIIMHVGKELKEVCKALLLLVMSLVQGSEPQPVLVPFCGSTAPFFSPAQPLAWPQASPLSSPISTSGTFTDNNDINMLEFFFFCQAQFQGEEMLPQKGHFSNFFGHKKLFSQKWLHF